MRHVPVSGRWDTSAPWGSPTGRIRGLSEAVIAASGFRSGLRTRRSRVGTPIDSFKDGEILRCHSFWTKRPTDTAYPGDQTAPGRELHQGHLACARGTNARRQGQPTHCCRDIRRSRPVRSTGWWPSGCSHRRQLNYARPRGKFCQRDSSTTNAPRFDLGYARSFEPSPADRPGQLDSCRHFSRCRIERRNHSCCRSHRTDAE
jgi:hypothetical protein